MERGKLLAPKLFHPSHVLNFGLRMLCHCQTLIVEVETIFFLSNIYHQTPFIKLWIIFHNQNLSIWRWFTKVASQKLHLIDHHHHHHHHNNCETLRNFCNTFSYFLLISIIFFFLNKLEKKDMSLSTNVSMIEERRASRRRGRLIWR